MFGADGVFGAAPQPRPGEVDAARKGARLGGGQSVNGRRAFIGAERCQLDGIAPGDRLIAGLLITPARGLPVRHKDLAGAELPRVRIRTVAVRKVGHTHP